MDIEFVAEQPAPADEPEDVLSAGRPRRVPRAIGTGVLALLVAAGGIGWLHGRNNDRAARPVSSPSSSTPTRTPIHEDVLAGCPDTLACDATHQMQAHQIDLIRRAMAQHQRDLARAAQARRSPPSWTGMATTGGTMAR
jgi:hypothetical protein